MRQDWLALLLLCPLLGCNVASDAAADPRSASPAAVAQSGVTLRIVRRVHPDPAWMKAHLDGRLDMCMEMLRANGQEGAPRPPLPHDAEIAKWVTVEQEEIYSGEQLATFSTSVLVWPDEKKGCRLTQFKHVSASTEALCGVMFAGSAQAEPGASDEKPPSFDEDKRESRADIKEACRADARKKRSTSDLARGVTHGGQSCYWVDVDGKPGDGPVEPKERGVHACVHPRNYDGSLPQGKHGGLLLRAVRVFGPAEKIGDGLKFGMPETDAMRIEAEIVEEGQPIAPSRFDRAAVEAYVRQPLVLPVQGENHASK
jgi:hypothetical protein